MRPKSRVAKGDGTDKEEASMSEAAKVFKVILVALACPLVLPLVIDKEATE